jgi:protein-tyrosine-phosphatase
MAAALLRRLLAGRDYDWSIESAGVLGHDGAPAEREARDAMTHMGLDIHTHEARMLTDELAAQAALLLTIDRGTALVLRSRFGDLQSRVHTLGELAGQPRDIPDPFRMQLGAWMTYAREIEALLTAALPRMIALLSAQPAQQLDAPQPSAPAQQLGARGEAVAQIAQLLHFVDTMPGVVDWAAARAQIESGLNRIAAEPLGAGDLVAAYAGLLRAALAMTPNPPSGAQRTALRDAVALLGQPIEQAALNAFSARLASWTT